MARPKRKNIPSQIYALKRFLLEEGLPERDGKPLFDSLSDLSRAVIAFEDSPPGLPSVIAMIQQGLTGVRPFKTERGLAMRRAVLDRIREYAPGRFDNLSTQFDYCFNMLDRIRHHPYEIHSSRGASYSPPGNVFVIAPYVQDVVNTPGGRALIQAFVATYGLSGSEVPPSRQNYHCLAFSSENEVQAFLVAVILEAVHTELGGRDYPIRIEHIERVLLRLEAEARRRHLALAILPPAYCLGAVTVYDCEKEEGPTVAMSYADQVFQSLPLRGEFRRGYRRLYFSLRAGEIEGARFISPQEYHARVVYQILASSAGV